MCDGVGHRDLPQRGVLFPGSTPACRAGRSIPGACPGGPSPSCVISTARGCSHPPGQGLSRKSHQVPGEATRGGRAAHCHLLTPKPNPQGTARCLGELPLGGGSSAAAPHAPLASPGLGLEPAEDRHGVSSSQPHWPPRGGLLGKGSPRLCRVARKRGQRRRLPVLGGQHRLGVFPVAPGSPQGSSRTKPVGGPVSQRVWGCSWGPLRPSAEVGAGGQWFPPLPLILPQVPILVPNPRGTPGPPWDEERRDAAVPAPPHPPSIPPGAARERRRRQIVADGWKMDLLQ